MLPLLRHTALFFKPHLRTAAPSPFPATFALKYCQPFSFFFFSPSSLRSLSDLFAFFLLPFGMLGCYCLRPNSTVALVPFACTKY